jgi:hypothetical protein
VSSNRPAENQKFGNSTQLCTTVRHTVGLTGNSPFYHVHGLPQHGTGPALARALESFKYKTTVRSAKNAILRTEIKEKQSVSH